MAENTFVLKLTDGSDIFAEVEKLVKDNDIGYGMFVSGCGRLKQFELISHEQKGGLSRMKFENDFELDAISGKVQKTKAGNVTANIRVSITRTGFTPKAGQLITGKAAKGLELGIRKVDLKKIIEA